MELENRERFERNQVIRSFKRRLGERSSFEEKHATRVAVYAVAIGSELGLSEDRLLSLRYAAELHDLGKLDFPQGFFQPGPVDSDLMRRHPKAAISLLESYPWLDESLAGILTHHERWDGAGYPEGLSGEGIPLAGRIIAVAEAFDAMTMPVGWREPIQEKEALTVIAEAAGTQFDAIVVEAFFKIQPIVQPVGL